MDPTHHPTDPPPDESAPPLDELKTDETATDSGAARWISFGLLTSLMLVVLFFRPLSMFVEKSVVTYHCNRAVEAYANGDRRLAIREIDEALKWLPDSPQLLYLRAQIHAASGSWSASLVDYDRLVTELAPHYARAYLGRSRVYRETGDYDKSLADLQRVTELAPTTDRLTAGEVAYERSLVHHAQGKPAEAAREEAKASELGYSPSGEMR